MIQDRLCSRGLFLAACALAAGSLACGASSVPAVNPADSGLQQWVGVGSVSADNPAGGRSGTATTSSDGRAWQLHSTTARLHAVAFGGGWYVGVGDAGAISRSRDGQRWSSLAHSHGSAALSALTYGPEGFVAGSSDFEDAMLLVSSDGASWRRLPEVPRLLYAGLAYVEGALYLWGSTPSDLGNPRLYRRDLEGGRTRWTDLTPQASASEVGATIAGLASSRVAGQQRFVFVVGGRAFVSDDGAATTAASWREGERPGVAAAAVAQGRGRIVVADRALGVASSADGLTWRVDQMPRARTDGAIALGYSEPLGFLLLRGEVALRSADGQSWYEVAARPGQWRAVTSGPAPLASAFAQ